ncbi:MAG: prevent-host-death family protein [Myxococcota bacterium]|jgi:prevent-host-death family protein
MPDSGLPKAPECSYIKSMNVATPNTQVGIRELKNNLSRYLARVRKGEEIIVTDHGTPVARLLNVDAKSDRLAALIASGAITPPLSPKRSAPKPIVTAGSVSDLVADQRR